MGRLFEQLKRRNVLRTAVGYAVVAWLIIQVADTVFPILGVPDWVTTMVVILIIIGFPVTVVVSWIYQWTPAGIMTEQEADAAGYSEPIGIGRQIDFVIIVLLVIAVGWLVYDKTSVAPVLGNSIAVLPFINMSDDPGNEYFSDGMSEEILNLLARTPGLKVIGRTSSFSFKGKNEDLRVIGETLGVKTILDGSVRKSGDRVRIAAQLINVSDGAHIWSDTYDRTLSDVFAVQDDVAAAIIGALQLHVSEAPSRGRPTENMDAYALFLRTKVLMRAQRFEETEKVVLGAIKLDPDFAEAYELLAVVYWALSDRKKLYDASAKALSINPNLVMAKALYESASVGTLLAGVEAFDWAIREQPNNPDILGILCWNLFETGYLLEVISLSERRAEIDPLSQDANLDLAYAYYAAGRTSEAVAAFELTDRLFPDQIPWHIGTVHLLEKQDESAIAKIEEAVSESESADTAWVRELVTAARDPATGQAYLDRRIPQIAADLQAQGAYDWQWDLTSFYLFFGFLDRFFEHILNLDLTNPAWTGADLRLYQGTLYRRVGFTAHPKYLQVAEASGIIDVWEQRGPPDFCDKSSGKWVCE